MADEPRDLAPIEQPDLPAPIDINSLLPQPSLNELTVPEAQRLQQFQSALIVIGKSAGGALVCPGNQIGVAEASRCPYSAKCELLRVQKAPANDLCPIERDFILARFQSWCRTINADPANLREDERSVVDELVYLDVQEARCASILSKGEAARLSQINVKDSNPETGEWISWERVIHANATLLESLHTRKRMLMKEWMLTPEQKFKAAKAMGKLGGGDDLSKRLSARHDKLRALDVNIIDAEFIDSPDK